MPDQTLAVIENVVRRVLADPETGQTREYFFGSIPSDKVKMLTFVPVIEASAKTYLEERADAGGDGDGEGYQRPGSTTRMNLFARYLGDHPLSVVPPVVISGRGEWRFEGSGDVGIVSVYDSAAIID